MGGSRDGQRWVRWLIAASVGATLAAGCGLPLMLEATAAPTFDPKPPAGWAWHDSPSDHRDSVGLTFDYVCPADGGLGPLWGTDTYTDDSSVCTAAVHMGFLTREVGGIVRIVVRPGLEAYEGSMRNGVLSEAYGSWAGSFTVVASCRGDECAATP
jgi:hypothetical protein